jgi:acetyl-CoA carboxylase biotin carboxyl carrier protein
MTLTAADVAEILRLVEASAFDELSLEFEGLKLNFKRGAGADAVAGTDAAARADAAAGAAGPTAQHVIAAELPSAAAPAAAAPAAPTPIAVDPNSHDLRSPMLGTFYRAPKPGAPPFVTVGSAVEEDTIVGIIEVMKLMNTVRAQVRGTVAQVLAADGALVEYDEILLRVRKPV